MLVYLMKPKMAFLLSSNGNIDKNNLKNYIPDILEAMTQRYENIYFDDLKNKYLDKINYIVETFTTFKVRE